MMRDPSVRAVSKVSWPLMATVIALIGLGSVVVASATYGMSGSSGLMMRHAVGIAVGVVPLAVAWVLDYRTLKHWTGPLLLATSAVLLLVQIPGFGVEAGGARSWLQVAGLRLFQPSEPAKLAVIVILAGVISEYGGRIDEWRKVGRVFAYLAAPLALILVQPDLGTALVFLAITAGMLLVGGVRARYLVVLGVLAAMGAGGLLLDATVRGEDAFLEEYQLDRLVVFIDPGVDPDGAGYNLAQSKIAIGSGGLTGKGLRSGTQSNLNFLPERHTDFIFSVLGEELGFLGSLALLGLYLALLMVALSIALLSRDLYGALIAAGLVSMWTFQILVNVGMTVGIMPITGIPLPFMSFGSSFMVTNLAGVGLLLSVWARRYGA
jgi:rod shape determining protein RodA